MKDKPHIILGQKDVAEAASSENAFQVARRKFKEEHHLEFTEEQFWDTSLFRHEIRTDDEEARITYLGVQ